MDILIILTTAIIGMVITRVTIMDIGMAIMPTIIIIMVVIIMVLVQLLIVQMDQLVAGQDMIIYQGVMLIMYIQDQQDRGVEMFRMKL